MLGVLVFVVLVIVQAGNSMTYSCPEPKKCTYPCSRISNGGYTSLMGTRQGDTSQFSCDDPSSFVNSEGVKNECYESNGPFLVLNRNKYEYQCLKFTPLDPEGRLPVFYTKPAAKYYSEPTLCEVCTVQGKWQVQTFVATSILDKICEKTKYGYTEKYYNEYRKDKELNYEKVLEEAVGCNVPFGCEANGYGNIPCSECELTEGDAKCCKTCL